MIRGYSAACSAVKSAYNAGSLVWEDSPGERNGNPLQYSCLRNPLVRSLVGHSPWGCKESDMT